MLASDADREEVVEILTAAFVQGRLGIDELSLRAGHALASRTYAELATTIDDIPVPPFKAAPAPRPGPAAGPGRAPRRPPACRPARRPWCGPPA